MSLPTLSEKLPTMPIAEKQALPVKIFREQPVTIDKLFKTPDEFVRFARHLGNGNPISHFLTVWRDKDGNANFARAKPHRRLDDAARAAYAAATGTSQFRTSIGVYPKNQDNKSTFGAMDYDSHHGADELAKSRAIRAFSLLLEYRDRYLILSASGRGYHVFIIAREPRPVAEWALMLKDTADIIGATIQDGVCEIFPNERTAEQEFGRAIRLPGTLNPATDESEKIIADTIGPLLEHLAAVEKLSPDSICISRGVLPGKVIQVKGTKNSSYQDQASQTKFLTISTQKLIDEIILAHPIRQMGTRNGVLLKLIGSLVHKFGRQLSERIVRKHFQTYQNNIGTPLETHLDQFSSAWNSILCKTKAGFSPTETRIFDGLSSGPQQEAFCLLRSFSRFAKDQDFQVSQISLADRLSVSQPLISMMLANFVSRGAIKKTAAHIPSTRGSLYIWTANQEQTL